VAVNDLVAAGGLPEKNRLLMQIYADVTGREIKVVASRQAGALGSAMFGAVAAGRRAGGYDTIVEAAQKMAQLQREGYRPIPAHQRIYDELYAEYVQLYDYFGRGANDVMKRLKRIKARARS
jgi:L-ribulokinase